MLYKSLYLAKDKQWIILPFDYVIISTLLCYMYIIYDTKIEVVCIHTVT